MKKVGVLYYSASRASQDMCRQPQLGIHAQTQYAIQSSEARDVADLVSQANINGINSLTQGNVLYLDSVCPFWRNQVHDL